MKILGPFLIAHTTYDNFTASRSQPLRFSSPTTRTDIETSTRSPRREVVYYFSPFSLLLPALSFLRKLEIVPLRSCPLSACCLETEDVCGAKAGKLLDIQLTEEGSYVSYNFVKALPTLCKLG